MEIGWGQGAILLNEISKKLDKINSRLSCCTTTTTTTQELPVSTTTTTTEDER